MRADLMTFSSPPTGVLAGSPGMLVTALNQPRAMLLILRISASSAFSALVSSRSCVRCPPCQALREAVALPSGVRGPVLCFHGCHCRISSACRCRRSDVQSVVMLVLQ